jgi:aspartyl/glutamyl-tRNA(Asn/Gln) amidotransferase C subunit
MVSEEKILNLAKQIYMGLTDEEVKKLVIDVEKEAESTKIINEVDTSNVKQDVSVLNRSNSLRKDEVEAYEDLDSLLANAKKVEDKMFVLPKIVQN